MNENDRLLKDLKKGVDADHRRIDGADAPPADLWDRILAQANPQPKETKQMSSMTTAAIPAETLPAADTRSRPGFGHYANLAATIALVIGIAVAGWFAIMQLNQSGGPEPSLALVNSTPEAEATPTSVAATCEVEPLSTDTVMEIVKNPARFMANGPTGEPSEKPMVGNQENADLRKVDPDLELVGESTAPTEEQFNDASVFANAYLDCLLSGTQGQVWTFYSPVFLQQKILSEFPVFAEESQVRERVVELSAQPAYEAEYAWVAVLSVNTSSQLSGPPEWEFDSRIGSLEVNPDYQLTRVHRSESAYYENVLSIGASIEDVDGEQTVLTNGVGNSIIPVDPFGSGMNAPMIYVQVAKLRSSDGWVIIPWPSESEMGWDQY